MPIVNGSNFHLTLCEMFYVDPMAVTGVETEVRDTTQK